MAFGRALLVLGIACFAASVMAQPLNTLTTAITTGDLSSGNYLVDGTGVVYDSNFLSIYVNGTVIGTIPIPAEAPKAGLSHTDLTHPDLTHSSQAQTPGATEDLLGSILGQLDQSNKPNPLDQITVGRKMK